MSETNQVEIAEGVKVEVKAEWYPKVGEVVVYVVRGQMPKTTNVHRVTPKGKIGIDLDEGKKLYKRSWRFTGNIDTRQTCYEDSLDSHRHCYVYPLSALPALEQEYDAELAAQEEKRQENKRKQEERDQRSAKELAEVQSACLAMSNWPGFVHEVLPDDSRLYRIHLPVKPDYAERKKEFEILIVRCWNDNTSWRSEDMPIRSAYTYCNGDNESFSSCSSYGTKTDEDAVWEACRNRYHSW